MRILFLSHYFPPEGNAPATRVSAMATRWVASGDHVTVITCAPNVPNGVVYAGYQNRLYQRALLGGIETIRVWTYLAANQGTVRRIANFLSYMVAAAAAALFVQRPDVIVATSPQFFCGWAGVLASRIRRVPFVLEIRDLWPESIVTVGAMRRSRLVAILEWLEHRMYAAAERIVAVGDGYRDELIARGVPAEKITVVSNGVDSDVFQPRAADPALRDRWGLGDAFVCAYVGTVGMASGLDVVLRAARVLKDQGRDDIRLLIVGDGAARADLEQACDRDRLDNVIFTGRLDKALMPPLLASIDACLVHLKNRPLFSTVMPSKIFEAAAMAKPIILGVRGYAAALVERARCGVCIEPEDDAALVAAVKRLADDRPAAIALGQQGHEFFVRHFNRAVLAQEYLDLLHAVGERAGVPSTPADTRPGDASRSRPVPSTPRTVSTSLREQDA